MLDFQSVPEGDWSHVLLVTEFYPTTLDAILRHKAVARSLTDDHLRCIMYEVRHNMTRTTPYIQPSTYSFSHFPLYTHIAHEPTLLSTKRPVLLCTPATITAGPADRCFAQVACQHWCDITLLGWVSITLYLMHGLPRCCVAYATCIPR